MIKDSTRVAIIDGERQVTFSELLQRIHHFSACHASQRGERIILFSENRRGWIYAFFSIWNQSSIAVPVDASSTVEDLTYIVQDCKPSALWVSRQTEPVARQTLSDLQLSTPLYIIDEQEDAALTADKSSLTYEDRDTAVIMYTSGTTGSPKGVMLSFANLFANMRSVSEEVEIYNAERRTMILLPLHHILPLQGTVIFPILCGGGVAICPNLSGPAIMDTLCRGRIAIVVGVPRLWQTLYAGIKKKIDASALTRALFNLCQRIGSRSFSRLVFGSVHRKMGGHIFCFVSGGAALDREVGVGLRTLGIDVLEGYGMTEAAPMIAFTRPGDIVPGSVGLPLPSVTCKLVEGELWAKGPNIMQGYLNRPEETAAVLDAEGYVHTGDLASFDEHGRLYITGRSKEIIVLSNGKNIQPNEIEFKLEKYDTYVREVAITQDGDQLCAIIVPQEQWAAGMTDEDISAQLKRLVVQPYNEQVVNYKKVMRIVVFRGDLPRTKLDKLQRFKLKDLLLSAARPKASQQPVPAVDEPDLEEYRIIKTFLEKEKHLTVRSTDHTETDLCLDSLDNVELQGFIENTFGVLVKADEVATFPHILALAEHIARSKTRMQVEETDWHSMLHHSSPHLTLPHPSCTYYGIIRCFRAFFRLYNHLQVTGTSHIPTEGPCLLVPNHQSFVDGPLVMAGLDRRTASNCYFYAKEMHVKGGLRRAFAARHNIIIMERKNLKDSILKLGEVLKQGKNVVIFPEGHRTEDGQLGTFKKTFAILSKELQVPIVPVCIQGAYEALPIHRSIPLARPISVTYLPPIYPTPAQSYDELTERVRQVLQTELAARKAIKSQ